MKSYNYQVAGTLTLTTTGNVDDLDIQGCGTVLMNNASLATIRGIKAGFPGQTVNFISIGAGEVDLAPQNTNSSANNRLINSYSTISMPLAPGFGNSMYQYDEVTARWRQIIYNQGKAISIPFSAGNFTASGSMTWTVILANQISYKYLLDFSGKIIVWFTLNSTTVGGTPDTELRIAIPLGLLAVNSDTLFAIRSFDNGSDTVGFDGIVASAGYIRCWRAGFSNWALSTSNTSVQGVAEFTVIQ